MTKKIDVLLEAQRELNVLADILSKVNELGSYVAIRLDDSELMDVINTEVNNVLKHIVAESKTANVPHEKRVISVKQKSPEEERTAVRYQPTGE